MVGAGGVVEIARRGGVISDVPSGQLADSDGLWQRLVFDT
jgi:hypothetical protein